MEDTFQIAVTKQPVTTWQFFLLFHKAFVIHFFNKNKTPPECFESKLLPAYSFQVQII